MIERHAIVQAARGWLGTPWVHQACLKGVGSDCIGLVAGVARELRIPEAAAFFNDGEIRGYGRQPNPKMLLRACDRYLDHASRSDADYGDIVLIRFDTDPMHFAIVSSDCPFYVIHALASAGKIVEHRVDDVWAARIMRVYRFRGVV
jgi:NlpC/P60 family putative phage cell wall peptidase